MRQPEAEQKAQNGETGSDNEGGAWQENRIEQESTCRRAYSDAEACGCGLLAELPTLRASGLGRNPVGQDRREDAGAGRDRTDRYQVAPLSRITDCHSNDDFCMRKAPSSVRCRT